MTRRVRRAAHAGAGQPAHLRGAALPQPSDAADHALGNSGRADPRPDRAPGQIHRALIVNGKTVAAAQFLKDPDIKTSDADLVASTHAQVRVRDDLNATADMVNKLEVMRKQIADQRKANAEKPTWSRRSASSIRKCSRSSCSSFRART